MKIMCNLCGRVSDLMASTSFAAEEGGQLKTYHFCSEEHLAEFARRKGITLNKD
jgi:YHS domain-containing protein